MQKVLIIGCGWLGQQLGVALADAGYLVTGSRQTLQSLSLLPKQIQPLLLQLPAAAEQPSAELLALLRDAWLICALPPAAQRQTDQQYLAALAAVSQLAQLGGCCGVIHCSSTGIYQGLSGEVDEQSPLTDQPKVQLLFQAEQQLQQFQPCITLRLAGLIGPGRHPARLSRGRPLTGPELPVNLVHATDIMRFIMMLLQQPAQSQCVNLCCPEHPVKAEFYQAAAAKAGLPAPVFIGADQPPRWVSAQQSLACGFCYQYPSPVAAIDACMDATDS